MVNGFNFVSKNHAQKKGKRNKDTAIAYPHHFPAESLEQAGVRMGLEIRN